MERDEDYVPKTREDLGIPTGHSIDYADIFSDTPLFTLGQLIAQQLLGFPAYFCQYLTPSYIFSSRL